MPDPTQFTSASSLGEALLERAAQPARDAYIYLHARQDTPPGLGTSRDNGDVVLSYAEAAHLARRAAAHLSERGVAAGDRVLLVLSTGPSFLAAFFGCQLLGAVPVPVVPPWSLARIEAHLERIARISRITEASAAVTSGPLLPALGLAHERGAAWPHGVLLGSDLFAEEGEYEGDPASDAEAPALIQFTSGSTAEPRGVVISQRALMANLRAIGEALSFVKIDIVCAWLPMFHDMGLVGHFLTPMAWNIPAVLMPPERFLLRPAEWLRAVSRFRASVSTAPNFAYSLCTRRVRDEELEGVDLSCWRLAMCGGEPVRPRTAREFIQRFERLGFAREAFLPVYGLAEFTLAATIPETGRGPRILPVDRSRFERDGLVEDPGDGDVCEWVSVGRPVPGGAELRVVDAARRELPEGREGDIELRGPSLMSGYYLDPEATAETLVDGWLRTGDRGFLRDGELFVTGRSKEIIVVRGRNIYPHDVEDAADAVAGVRAGRSAAIAVPNEETGTEELVVVCETRRASRKLEAAVARAVHDRVGVRPHEVVLAPPGVISKTSSGKVQRNLIRQRYLAQDWRVEAAGVLTRLRLWAGWLRWRARSLFGTDSS